METELSITENQPRYRKMWTMEGEQSSSHRLNKGFRSKCHEVYLNQQTSEEGQRVQLPKHCDSHKGKGHSSNCK